MMSSSNPPFEFESPRRDAAGQVCPSLMELAAYVEHTLEASESAKLRDHVSSCPTCAALITDLDDCQSVAGNEMIFVPPHVLEAAMALVPADSSELAAPRKPAWFVVARRVAAAAAAVGVCAGGYQLGAALDPRAPFDDAVVSELSFDLFNGSELEGELFALASTFDQANDLEPTP